MEAKADIGRECMFLYAAELCRIWLGRLGELGICKKQLAERLRVNRSFVSRIFQCKVNLTLATIAKINQALEMTWKDLVKRSLSYEKTGENNNDD